MGIGVIPRLHMLKHRNICELLGNSPHQRAFTFIAIAAAAKHAPELTGAVQARENDVVLLAGKGHEDYQIVGNRRLDYSDRVTAARLLGVVA